MLVDGAMQPCVTLRGVALSEAASCFTSFAFTARCIEAGKDEAEAPNFLVQNLCGAKVQSSWHQQVSAQEGRQATHVSIQHIFISVYFSVSDLSECLMILLPVNHVLTHFEKYYYFTSW